MNNGIGCEKMGTIPYHQIDIFRQTHEGFHSQIFDAKKKTWSIPQRIIDLEPDSFWTMFCYKATHNINEQNMGDQPI